MGFKKYDGSTWQPITPKKSKGIPYTGTLPATLTGTKAGYLHKYKIFGNTEQTGTPTPENPIVPQECGERTENLFNYGENLLSRGSYGQAVIKKNNGLYIDRYVSAAAGGIIFNFEYNTQYTLSFKRDGNANVIIYMFDSDIQGDTFPTNQYNYISIPYNTSQYTFSIADFNVKTVIIGVSGGSTQVNTGVYDIIVCIGKTPPTSYIPYGYKLPLTSGSTPVDIYIGDDTLSDTEYVDSGTGKIYRMVGGVLTPVDPPVPFPQIPTAANSTTINWSGSGLAPSEFDSIQEWVDIATYTYTNGEWVADN